MESGTDRGAATRRLSRRIAVAVMVMAAVVVAGWVLDVGILKSFLPGLVSMKINTALGLLVAGWGVLRLARTHPHRDYAALACAFLVFALGAFTVLEHEAGIDPGFDQALVRDAREDGNPGPSGQMAPATAFTFMLVGLALLCLTSSRPILRVAGQAAAVLAAGSSLLTIAAYLLEGPVPLYSRMALHTAAGFFALGIAILCARPEGALMEPLMDDHAGGAATRRMLPVVILVPVLLAWLKLEGRRVGLYDTGTGTLLLTCSIVVSLALLVWWNGRSFSRSDAKRRRADGEVRASETRWRQLADAMPQIVWSASAEGWIDYFNQRWVEYTDLPPDLPVAHQLVAAMHPGEVEVILDAWRDAVEHGLRYEGELRFRRASDGQYRWHLARALPVRDASGEITKWYGTCTDIEDQKTATETAERANRAKGDFLANMSHEIRTPMNGIIGLSELLLATPLTRVQRDYQLMISDSAERLLSVINGILDHSKIESGGMELDERPFSLREVVAQAARGVGVAADAKGLELSYRVAPDAPDAVVGDDGRLRQVLVNLLGNAVKFTEHGQVVLEIEQEWEQAGEVALHGVVRDTGIGIAPQRREAIFEPFTQADGSTTRAFGGTGLGLTISSQLVALMGGEMWVESEVGRGSAFHFRIRLDLQAPAALPAPRPGGTPLQGLRILVADDAAINHRILDEMLRAWGCTPTVVGSAEAALAALAEARAAGTPYRLALFDARMPGMDGFALAEKVRGESDGAPAVLMMLSSGSHAAEAARCHALGDLAYVVKPVDPSHLLGAILGTLMPSGDASTAVETAPPAAARALQVLVAEDNKVNQRLMLGLLSGLGHQATLVGDGRQAVAAARAGGFDIALLDVHMPEMDGFEATTAIRAFEKETGGHLPIAAVTAGAMKGDREACLAAGMDDYLPKPVRLAELLAVIGRLAPAANASGNGGESFDADDVLARVEGDRALLAELVDIFREEYPRLLARVRASVDSGDARGVHEAAHAIKGTVGNFGARAASEAALALEVMGQEGVLTGAGAAFDRLERELDHLARDLARMGHEATV